MAFGTWLRNCHEQYDKEITLMNPRGKERHAHNRSSKSEKVAIDYVDIDSFVTSHVQEYAVYDQIRAASTIIRVRSIKSPRVSTLMIQFCSRPAHTSSFLAAKSNRWVPAVWDITSLC